MDITIETPTGNKIKVDADSALIGRDRKCQIALPDEPALQPIHAKIRKVADRWLIEAQGDWQIQVGAGLPGRMSWLKPGDVIRLTESGPEIIFDEAAQPLVQARAPSTPIPKAQTPQLQLRPKPVAVPPIPATAEQPSLPAMVEEWFYASAGQKCGPFPLAQLKQLAKTGVLRTEDMVWKAGMPKWVQASSIPALFPDGPPSPPIPAPLLPPAVAPPLPPATPTAPPMATTVPPSQPTAQERIVASNPPKDPILMAVLSFFIPWLGQILIGQVAKGIVMLLLTPFLVALFVIATLGMGLVVLPFLNLIAVIDAYLLAKKLKEGKAIGDWEFFGIESAASLSMPDLLPKATDQSGKPVVAVNLRPPGLVGSAIGMLFVSGLAMMISLLGVVGIVVNERMPAVMQILLALSFIHNAWVIFAILQMMKMQRYAFAITAPLLVMGSWLWLSFSGIPIGLSVIGILGGISVGLWALGVLRQPEVRAAFANQYDPLETLLPMAKATIQGQSPNLEAIKGLAKQLVGNKIALGIGGVVLLLLLVVPLFSLFGPSQHKSKFLGAAPEVATNKKDRAAKSGKKKPQDDDYTRNLPASEAKTLVKRYIELSRSVPDDDERREMSQLLNTLVSHGAGAAPVTVALARMYVELSQSVPDDAEQKEMSEILSALGRLGVHARAANPILSARYKELSESVPDDSERREMTLILQTIERIGPGASSDNSGKQKNQKKMTEPEPTPTGAAANSSTFPTLTKDYFPQTGTERHLIRKQISENGSVREAAFTAKFSANEETSWLSNDPKVRGTIKHRQNGEYLEYLNPGKTDWARFLKLQAKPGDSWEYKYGAGVGRYTYKENIALNGKPCAVLEYQWLKDGKARIQTTSWYVKGVGVVREQSKMSDEKGNWRNTGDNLFEEWSDETASRYKALVDAKATNGDKQAKTDVKKKTEALPAKTITLTPEVKAVFKHVTEYGGRLFADGTRQDAPIVAVRAFGFGQDTKKLTALPSLEHLDLRGKLVTQKMSNFDPASLKQFKNLKTLALGPISPQDLSHLAAIETLETVSFEVDVGGKRPKGIKINDTLQSSLAEVAKLKALKHLRVGNGGSSFGNHPSDFAAVPSCPNLTYLESWVICDDAALAHIGKSQSLKKLVIVFPKGVVGVKATFSAKGLAALAAASNLSSVQLNDADDALCEAMADLPKLKELIVGGSVTKSAIGRVKAKHPDLRIISYREAFQPPFAEPRDNWMQVLPPNRWRQVMFSKKTSAFLLGPVETNNTENFFD